MNRRTKQFCELEAGNGNIEDEPNTDRQFLWSIRSIGKRLVNLFKSTTKSCNNTMPPIRTYPKKEDTLLSNWVTVNFVTVGATKTHRIEHTAAQRMLSTTSKTLSWWKIWLPFQNSDMRWKLIAVIHYSLWEKGQNLKYQRYDSPTSKNPPGL